LQEIFLMTPMLKKILNSYDVFKFNLKLLFLSVFFIIFVSINAASQNYPYFENIPEPYQQIEKDANSGKVDLAIAKLNLLIKENPNNFIAYYVRALIYSYHAGLYDKAIEDFDWLFKFIEGHEFNPSFLILMFSYRSSAYYLKGDYDKAIKDITESIAISNSTEGAHKFLPILYSVLGIYNSAKQENQVAIKHFIKSIELGSTEDYTFWGIGYSLHQTGQKERANFFFNKVSIIESANESHYLDKPISLSTKNFISKRINVASEYLPIPADTVTKALVYINAFTGKNDLHELTKKIQYLLFELGYNPGPIDGIFGTKTHEAILQFEIENALPAQGQISDELYQRLSATFKEAKKSKTLAAISIPFLIEKTLPAVVQIIGLNDDKKPFKFGSGFFVSKNLVITNYHVIEGSDTIVVKTHDGKYIEVNMILSKNPVYDLALIKVETPQQALHILKLEKKEPRIGETIFAIGSPLGLEYTVSDGIISALRNYKGRIKVLQITAPISQGSSGGPIINLNGDVVGVATMSIEEGQNLNFAVSVNNIFNMIKQTE